MKVINIFWLDPNHFRKNSKMLLNLSSFKPLGTYHSSHFRLIASIANRNLSNINLHPVAMYTLCYLPIETTHLSSISPP